MPNWIDVISIYDKLDDDDPSVYQLSSFKRFDALKEYLLSELDAATPSR
jgi:hypothetical protein